MSNSKEGQARPSKTPPTWSFRRPSEARPTTPRLGPPTPRGGLAQGTGRHFIGRPFGAAVRGHGEVVFNTAMTGYQEILTDPSYAGQMVCMTYPLQGNYGVRDADAESARAWARAMIVRWACPSPSHHSSESSLDEYLKRWAVPAITEIDTRALTR